MVNVELKELLSNLKKNGMKFELEESPEANYIVNVNNIVIEWDFNLDSKFQINNDGEMIGDGFTSISDVVKVVKLIEVRNRLTSMYKSYNPSDFSSPEYEIDEHLAEYLLTHSDVKVNPSKLHTIVRYYLDDSIENLYLNGISEGIVEDITQSESEQIIELILNH